MDKRTRARELAMQALYQLDVQGSELLGQIEDFFAENEADKSVRMFASELTAGAWQNLAQCDELIVGSTLKWEISRLSPVDRSILRLTVYQLRYCSDIPPKVAINEAIEIAKRYSTAQSPAFVNGVLDAVLKKLITQGIR